MMYSFEKYDINNKISKSKTKDMLNILIKFYNNFNKEDNSKKEVYEPWINMIRNTKDYNILLYYDSNTLVGFINYLYHDLGLMLSEIQIKEEYQSKYNILRIVLKEVLNISEKNRYKYIYGTINSKNIRSQQVFTHIGFENVKGNLYKISYDNLLIWIEKDKNDLLK